jgi:Restriction endonuclease fold toxin 7
MSAMLRKVIGTVLMATLLVLAGAPAVQARFLTPDTYDPWEEGVGTNRYSYSGDDPINNSDPNGHNDIGHNGGPPLDLAGPEDTPEFNTGLPGMDWQQQRFDRMVRFATEAVAGTAIIAVNQRNREIKDQSVLSSRPRTAGTLATMLGSRFEDAVARRYDVGNRHAPYRSPNGQSRFADGINDVAKTITEVKYVNYQGYTRQLKDMVEYARDKKFTARLVVPQGTYLSRPLREAAARGDITIIRTGMRSPNANRHRR